MPAKIIAHSISEAGKEIITFQLSYWRAIHGELKTHRAFSTSSMSSRAVPVAKMIAQVRQDPFIPKHVGRNQPGMQAHEPLTPAEREEFLAVWLSNAQNAAWAAQQMSNLGVAKQIANRVLEPYQIMHTVVTATEFDNFYALRRHADAEPHFHDLADEMWEAAKASTPIVRSSQHCRDDERGWHLPYISDAERGMYLPSKLIMASAARCARVSYLNHDGTSPEVAKDLDLFERLAGSAPIHASPLEHQAEAAYRADQESRNFRGWHQHREIFEDALHAQ
ncbi:FAD-dependent thymidylate synthase [Variovorax paradoxus]|nr:FAD-dependent thymidylate synthase [Variovorax paradoxus]